MNTEIAIEQKTTIITNPITIAETADRVDNAIAIMVEQCVDQIEDEVTRIVRRREVSAAIRGILRYKKELEELKTEPILAPALFLMAVEGMRPDLENMFRKINPKAADTAIKQIVEDTVREYIVFLQSVPVVIPVETVKQFMTTLPASVNDTIESMSTPSATKKKKSGKSDVGS